MHFLIIFKRYALDYRCHYNLAWSFLWTKCILLNYSRVKFLSEVLSPRIMGTLQNIENNQFLNILLLDDPLQMSFSITILWVWTESSACTQFICNTRLHELLLQIIDVSNDWHENCCKRFCHWHLYTLEHFQILESPLLLFSCCLAIGFSFLQSTNLACHS